MGGTASAQVLMILAAPVLTRLYTPNDFGVLAVFVAMTTLVAAMGSFRYELAIPLPEDPIEAQHVVVLCFCILLVVTGLSALVFYWWCDYFVAKLKVPELASFIWLVPVGIFVTGAFNILNFYSIRNKDFPTISKAKIGQSVLTVLVQVAGFSFGCFSLLGGMVAGKSAGAGQLGSQFYKNFSKQQTRPSDLVSSGLRYRKFALFTSWGGLFNVAGQQIPPLIIASVFTSGVAGLYAMAHRIVAMPLFLIGGAMGNVFFANAADAYREDRLGELVTKVHATLSKLAMPPALLLGIAGPDLFEFAFGTQWRDSGSIAQWLSLLLYSQFITAPLSSIFHVTEKQSYTFFLQALLLILRIGGLAYGAMVLNDIFWAVGLYAIGSCTGYLIFVMVAFAASGAQSSEILKSLAINFVISLAMLTPVIMVKFSGMASHWVVVAALLSGIIILIRLKKAI